MERTDLPSSFRDPSGVVFIQNESIFRQVNISYRECYDKLIGSGLYAKLVEMGLLIPHEEINLLNKIEKPCYIIIQPQPIPFVSYPYEWSFNQLKDAALTTLAIEKVALEFGMTLKDCSAYNIQFLDAKPVFIDTLSFEKYIEGEPWIAYRQFCQHFLAPVALMSYCDIQFNRFLSVFIDGIPLPMASKLLPFRTKLYISFLMHIHFHAKAQEKYQDSRNNFSPKKVSLNGLLSIIDSLQSVLSKLKPKKNKTEWGEYYCDTNYTDESFDCKKSLVALYLDYSKPSMVWDMGANTGIFSKIAIDRGIPTVSFDIDPVAVDMGYLEASKIGRANHLHLPLDLANPSPAIGWNNRERYSLLERGPADTVMALALIHHISISNNVPLTMAASFFKNICKKNLIIEFVPKNDSQVVRLLKTRQDIFGQYDQKNFELAFSNHFRILRKDSIKGSERVLYLMGRK